MQLGRSIALPSLPLRKARETHFGPRGRRARGVFLRGAFCAAAACGDAAAIIASALVCGMTYHWAFYVSDGMATVFFLLGAALSVFFVAPGIVRDEYSLAQFNRPRTLLGKCFVHWNAAFVSAILLAFMSKTLADLSRVTMVLLYVVGFLTLVGVRSGFRRLARTLSSTQSPVARRVFLVGSEREIERFSSRYAPGDLGVRIVSASVVRSEETMKDDLALAAATARLLCPDDVIILLPWSETKAIEACIESFLRVPASISLGPEPILERYGDASIDELGGLPGLRLVRGPLRTFDLAVKRAMDIVGASIGLLVFAPIFSIVTIAIKLDSRGPALFSQRRYGFNQEPFRIYKFRSMRVAEDDRHVRQATQNDARITRVGAFIRRWNLDELPQLINVLEGDMSLVGPRPHALAHDQSFDRTVTLYARRHNVKPGITGWAQVNGYRGEIVTPNDIRKRVEHDLHYIDHWTPLLDLKIIFLTVFSRRAYRGAR